MALRPISFTFFARPTLCLAFKKNGTPIRPGASSGSPKNKDWRKPASAPALSAVRLSPKLPWFHLYFNSCKNFGNLLFAPKPTQVGFDGSNDAPDKVSPAIGPCEQSRRTY